MSKVTVEKGKEASSRSCPSACGFMISGRDSHPMCIACMGAKHAQASLANTESCVHCQAMPMRILERRLRVAASSKDDPVLSAAPSSANDAKSSPPRDLASWGDIMEVESPVYEPLFDQQLLAGGDEMEGDEEEDDETLARLLRDEPDDEEEDVIRPSSHTSRPTSAQSGEVASTVVDCDLTEVCKRAAAKLGVAWPVTPGHPGVKRDVYDGKRLAPRAPPAKQLLPALPDCITEMKRSWDKPFTNRVPVKGYSSLDVSEMEGLGLSNPPVVEQTVALHLHPNRRAAVSSATPSLPGKMERFTASMYQKIYKSSALTVRALNVTSLLTAYQAELLEELGTQLDAGNPNPAVWQEICNITDLNLRASRRAVQSSGRTMALAVAGERSLWLNLSSIGDREKLDYLDAPVDSRHHVLLFLLLGPLLRRRAENLSVRPDRLNRTAQSRRLAPPLLQTLSHGESSHSRQRLQSPDPLTPPPKRRGTPRTLCLERRDGQHLGFSAMSSPQSATVVSPPAKMQRRWNLGGEMVQSCVQASSASPQHTMFRGLPTAVPQVHVQSIRPPCGLPSSGTRSQVRCHKALHSLCSWQIKNALSHPGSMPRAQKAKNKIKTQRKAKAQSRETGQSLSQTDPGQISLWPQEGASTPSVGPVRQQPLSLHPEAWIECSPHPWVLATVTRGYRLQFAGKPPPFNGVIASVANEDSAQVLEAEISSLMGKGAIRRVPVEETQTGFYSRYFLIPKKDGSLRPILDLRALNKHLRKYKFKMLTVGALTRSIRRGDWFASIDLKDAYFHISIYPAHRKYLRFSFQNEVFEFVTLPFGLSLAPRVFSRCMEAALSPLRHKGLRISAYLDDYLICARTRERAERDAETLSSHLGFRINNAKSQLIPSQEIEYLGLRLDSVTYRAMLSERRITAFGLCLTHFRKGNLVSFRTCLRLMGMMASSLSVIPLGLLKMRDFQRWISAKRLCPRRHLARRVRVSTECVMALHHWKNPCIFRSGAPLGSVSLRKVVTTDASLTGWGAVFQGRSVNGRWTHRLRELHIIMLELMVVFLALKHFLPFLKGFHVLVRTDNTTVVAYINRQGGTRSLQLHNLARKLIVWSAAHLSSLRATHVPGVRNVGTDLLSRGNPTYGEWVLHPQVVNQIWEMYGKAAVDLFASRANAKCPLYFSLEDEDAPLGVDALAHPWPNVLLYAFPPLSLISPTLDRVRESGLSLLLIAPRWPGRLWLAEIAELLQGEPWPLPLRRDLLSQAGAQIFHPHPEQINLWVWPVKG
ncbi:uncharacterized protein LOC130219008 [Danio aesculapii]|uniref:uncharacterized protein LOC130219008 n=1 Tax=Danio aesculapii TaxID=1142201 RepID=UPI0024C0D187|nr:uncharacterized protein LOC130219008 [Danio aesculapii]